MAATTINYLRTLSLVLLAYLSATQFTCAQNPVGINVTGGGGESLIVTTPQAILLKKTDRVLIGNVRPNGNFIEIEIADQSRVSIPRDQIEFVGANVLEIYEYKRRSIARWAIGDHFKLTRWCLQNQLLRQATEHYAEVEKQNADHPAVKQLGAELEQKILADEKFRAYAGLPPRVAAHAVASGTSIGNSPVSTDTVSTASAQTSFAEHPQLAMRFNDRVQPILMNRCSQSACHGVSSNNALRLIEPVGKAYARVSAENRKRVLLLSKPDANGTPKLLTYATKPHGLQKDAGIAISETQLLEELKAWIRLSENPVVPAVATASALSASPLGSQKLNPVAPGSTPPRAVPDTSAQHDFPTGAQPAMSEIDALDAQLSKILASEGSRPGATGRDPFDPAEFNRGAQQPR